MLLNKKVNSNCYYFFHDNKHHDSNNLFKLSSEIEDIIEGKDNIKLTYASLCDIVISLAYRMKLIVSIDKIKSKIQSFADSNGQTLNDVFDPVECNSLLDNICGNIIQYNIQDIVLKDDLLNMIKEQSTYIKGLDSIIIIGDRDKGSFKSNQYDEVLKIAFEKNIDLIISNPCIEFWFLLHHTDAKEIDKASWVDNDNVANLIFSELKKFDKTYKKSQKNYSSYIKKTDFAISNSKLYATELKQLKDNIGTNMSILFDIVGK